MVKKILALFTIIVLFSLNICSAETKLVNISLTDNNGAVVADKLSATTLKVTAEGKSGEIFVCEYDDNRKLTEVKNKPLDNSLYYSFTYSKNNVKAFVWDNKENIEPLDRSLFLNSYMPVMPLNNIEIENEKYDWKNIDLGGGGFMTGYSVQPNTNELYIRTDVGGAYKWSGNGWTSLSEWIEYEDQNLFGVQAICADPVDENVLYMSCGIYPNRLLATWNNTPYPQPNGVLKSTDKGKTWKYTGLNKDFYANGKNRTAGEAIAVNPQNNNIVYVGTVYDGLYRCNNATSDNMIWESVNLPDYNPPQGAYDSIAGISFIKFNGTNIYVGVMNKGIYASNDGGQSFTLMTSLPLHPMHLEAAESEIYVTSHEGVFRYDYALSTWKKLPDPWGTLWQGAIYGGLSVSKQNPNMIAMSIQTDSFYNPIFVSSDKGNSWRQILTGNTGPCIIEQSVPWWGREKFGACISWLHFDNLTPNKLWFGDWYGAWVTEDITAQNPVFKNFEQGHEEMVVFDMISTKGKSPLLSVMADNFGVRYDNTSQYPDTQFKNPAMTDGNGLDYCVSDPDIIAVAGNYNWGQNGGDGCYSLDNGITFTQFPSYPMNGSLRKTNGRVAVSSGKNEFGNASIIILPLNSKPYLSKDYGVSWTEIATLPTNMMTDYYSLAKSVCSDKLNKDIFYVYDKNSGYFYTSLDGGESFIKRAKLPIAQSNIITASMYKSGEIYISLNKSGLYHSSDFGLTFEKADGVLEAPLLALGKAAPYRINDTVYIYGNCGSGMTVYRSVDGKNFEKISIDEYALGCQPRVLSSDYEKFGNVFLGTGGKGIYKGEIKENYNIVFNPSVYSYSLNCKAGEKLRFVFAQEKDSLIYVNNTPAFSEFTTNELIKGVNQFKIKAEIKGEIKEYTINITCI